MRAEIFVLFTAVVSQPHRFLAFPEQKPSSRMEGGALPLVQEWGRVWGSHCLSYRFLTTPPLEAPGLLPGPPLWTESSDFPGC